MGTNLTQEELRKVLADNPDLVLEDDGVPMGEAPKLPTSVREILTQFNREYRAQAIEDEPGPKYKSKTEERAHDWLLEETKCLEIYYEPIMVRMPSGNYSPDFMLRMPNRELWFVEVKGDWKAYQSGRSSKKSLIEASKTFWFLGRWFSLVSIPKKRGGGWEFKEIK